MTVCDDHKTDPSGLRVCDASLVANDKLMRPQDIEGRQSTSSAASPSVRARSARKDIERCAQQIRDTARCSSFDAAGRPNCPEVWNECVSGQIATLSGYEQPGAEVYVNGAMGAGYGPAVRVGKEGRSSCLAFQRLGRDPFANSDLGITGCLPVPPMLLFGPCGGVGIQGGNPYYGVGVGSPGAAVNIGYASEDACDRSAVQVSVSSNVIPLGGPVFAGVYVQVPASDVPNILDAGRRSGEAEAGLTIGTPGIGANLINYKTFGCE